MISFLLTAKRLLSALWRACKERVFLSLLTTLFIINVSGVLFYRAIESWRYVDAIYFSWVSLIPTSVDIGFAPVTDIGKVFTMMYLVVGVGVMIGLLAMVAKAVVNFEKDEARREKWKHLREQRKEHLDD